MVVVVVVIVMAEMGGAVVKLAEKAACRRAGRVAEGKWEVVVAVVAAAVVAVKRIVVQTVQRGPRAGGVRVEGHLWDCCWRCDLVAIAMARACLSW